MKVLFLTGGFPSGNNPSKGIFNKRAAIEIAKKVDLTVIHYWMLKPGRKRIEIIYENGYELIRLAILQIPIFNKYTICFNTYLLQLYIKPLIRDYDLIHSVSGLSGISIGRLKDKFNFKHICQMIGDDINYILPELKKIGCVRTLKGIDKIVCNSNSLKRQVNIVYGIENNVSVIYRGVDLKKYLTIEKKLEKEIVFLFLGGLVDYKHSEYRNNLKGGLTLMNAWSIVDEKLLKNSPVKLLFGGLNTNDNWELINWRNKLINKTKVDLIGEINPLDILKVYQSSNITIIPSKTEGFPNVGMESFAAGNCVIGSDVGGIPELIDDKINGLIFRASDEKHLAEKIIQFMDLRIVNKMGEKAREKAINKFDSKSFGSNYLNIYLKE